MKPAPATRIVPMTMVRRRPHLWGLRAQGSIDGMSDHIILAVFLQGATPQGNPSLTPEGSRGIAAHVDSQPPPSGLGTSTTRFMDMDRMWKVGGAKS